MVARPQQLGQPSLLILSQGLRRVNIDGRRVWILLECLECRDLVDEGLARRGRRRDNDALALPKVVDRLCLMSVELCRLLGLV